MIYCLKNNNLPSLNHETFIMSIAHNGFIAYNHPNRLKNDGERQDDAYEESYQ